MVWKERGKYGIHTGRTLRKPSERITSRDRGFLIKAVVNSDVNVTDEDFRRYLKKAKVLDGFDDEDVVQESRYHRRWGSGRGFFSDSLLYSISKRKRWLLPAILKHRVSEDCGSESECKVVLVERVSENSSSWYSQSSRLKNGDCIAVLDGAELRKPKRRKFAHVGDLRKESDEPEVFYEVTHTESATSWPSYVQHDWREFRDQMKSRCKEKGKRNKRRLWGQYRKSELKKEAFENEKTSSSGGKVKSFMGKKKLMVLSENNFEYCSVIEGNNSAFPKFDIGGYICESLSSGPENHSKKQSHVKGGDNKNGKLSPLNSASSQFVSMHGKGSAVYLDLAPESDYHDNQQAFYANPVVRVQLTNGALVESKAVSQTVNLERETIDPCKLHKQFGELYVNGESVPHRFSICSENQDVKFVFTSQTQRKDGREQFTVTAISNELPARKFQILEQFLEKHFCVTCKQENSFEEPNNDTVHNWNPKTSNENQNRLAQMSFDLLYHVNRWSHKACLPSFAVPSGPSPNRTCCNKSFLDIESEIAVIPGNVTCEICCLEFYNDYPDDFLPCTALMACMHWFCNDCWRSYLSAEVQQGKTAVMCPRYDCDTPVDDVTIMALLPDSFPKFERMRQEKAVELDAKWKWCPGDKCNLVVMATGRSSVNENLGDVLPIPIRCDCGQSWCFSCQKEPHWPASCAQAAFFRSQTESYEKIVKTKAGGITSVCVKRCPHCHYPIEKNMGCPHMTCSMCMGQFCWECLEDWLTHDWGVNCAKRSKQEEEVELVNHVGSTRFNSHLRVAMANRMARATPLMYVKYGEVKKLEGVLQALDKISKTKHLTGESTSATALFLNQYNSHSVPKYLKASADFKFQAHFVIEGSSILMAVSKTKYGHKELKNRIATLLFVLERLEDMGNTRQLCSDSDKLHFQRLLNAGKNCIDSIRKLCVKLNKVN